MRRRYGYLAIALVLLLLVAAACSSLNSPEAAASVPTPPALLQPIALADHTDLGLDQNAYGSAQQPTNDTAGQRVVLKNAVLTLVVDDVDSKLSQINTLAGTMNGWVVSEQVTRGQSSDQALISSATITIRVDAKQLDAALTSIKTGVKTVQSEAETGQDVTQDYVDLNSQLTNLQAAEKQLQQIMDDAKTTDDVLSVYDELVKVRGQIETIQGRLNYYSQASAFASIQVTLIPTPLAQPVQTNGWQPLQTAQRAFQVLVNVLEGLGDFVIILVIIGIPLLIIFGIPFWLVRKRRRLARATRTVS